MGNSIHLARDFYNNTAYYGLIKEIRGPSRRQLVDFRGALEGLLTHGDKPKAKAKKLQISLPTVCVSALLTPRSLLV